MAFPLVPIAGLALRYGAVALTTYAVARKIDRGFFDQRAEFAMDDLNEGISVRRQSGQYNATGRFQRMVRLGKSGPGVKIDISALGRLRVQKV